ncbi:MAG: TIGR02206 family membrane protein [Streptococcaceae bacterium]|jgi:hypothetical integral membrane protein (TIGR02206 family)|nr:TIGR02206 family membrane protein [Streptococcaceae bacterium]
MTLATLPSFFISEENAKGPGFGLFSPTHLAVLVLLAVISFFICRAYRHSDDARKRHFRHVIAIVVLNLEFWKDIVLIVTGQFTYGNLPFQLCGLGIFFVALDAFKPSSFSRGLIYGLTMWGAVMALVTPNWVTSPIINIIVWQSFTIHMLLVTYCLMQLVAGDFKPRFKDLRFVALFLVVAFPILMLLNRLPGNPNFFFLEIPAPGSPLEPIHTLFGNFYLLGLVLLLIVLWLLLYTPWAIIERRHHDKS